MKILFFIMLLFISNGAFAKNLYSTGDIVQTTDNEKVLTYRVSPNPTKFSQPDPIGTLEINKEYLVIGMAQYPGLFLDSTCFTCKAPDNVYTKLMGYDEAISYLSEQGLNLTRKQLTTMVSQGVVNLLSHPEGLWVYSGKIYLEGEEPEDYQGFRLSKVNE